MAAESDQEDLVHLQDLRADLQIIFDQEKIDPTEISGLDLQTDEVEEYLDDLLVRGSPEEALRDKLIGGVNSVLRDFLFGSLTVETDISGGFIDYQVKDNSVSVEVKPPFTAKRNDQGEVKYLKRERLNWEDHKEQIQKYLNENRFLILTDLRQWYFFNNKSPDSVEPIQQDPEDFDDFFDDVSLSNDLEDLLLRKESQATRSDLNRDFFKSLEGWVTKLDEIDSLATPNGTDQEEAIINFINKIIFIQTLDDYSVVRYRFIEREWERQVRDWEHQSKRKVLLEFISRLDDWFYSHYDTEMFEQDSTFLFKQLSDDEIDTAYQSVKHILGVEPWQGSIGSRGVTNYNFRQIDEDVFGRAYETYLAKSRQAEGIYYTRKYVTQYITEHTVGERLDELEQAFQSALDDGDIGEAKEQAEQLVNLRVLDPACGSGSFLIKALRAFSEVYFSITERLDDEITSYSSATLEWAEEDLQEIEQLKEIAELLGYNRGKPTDEKVRDLLSKIVLRHIFGNDKDRRALDVAKLNIWLATIKQDPDKFWYGNISGEEGHQLPDLELNLSCGDALLSDPITDTVEELNENYAQELAELSQLRDRYIESPTQNEIVDEAVEIRESVASELNSDFLKGLNARLENQSADEDLVEIVEESHPILHWPLQFWFAFFEGDGSRSMEGGFDFIIGNPPYYNETREHNLDFKIYKNSPFIGEYYQPKMDVFYFFIEGGINLLKQNGELSYIILEYWNNRTYAESLNRKMAKETKVTNLVEFNEFNAFPALLGGDSPGIHSDIITLRKEEAGEEYIDGYSTSITSIDNSDLSEETINQVLNNGLSVEGVTRKTQTAKFRDSEGRLTFVDADARNLVSKIESESNTTIPEDDIKTGTNVYIDKITGSVIDDLEDRGVAHNFTQGEGVFVLSEDELAAMDLNEAEKELIKPFYWGHQVDQYYVDNNPSDYLIYTENKLIDYDGYDINSKARELVEDQKFEKSQIKSSKKDKYEDESEPLKDVRLSDLDDDTKSNIKEEAKGLLRDEMREKYPTITAHLDKYLEKGVITSDRKPYGIHRSREQRFFEGDGRVVSIRKTRHPTVAHVEFPCYMDEAVYVIQSDTPREIECVLNSKVIDYWFRNGPQKAHGDMLQIDKDVLEPAPIKTGLEDSTLEKADEIRELRSSEQRLLQLWEDWTGKLGTRRPLEEILSRDKKRLEGRLSDPSLTQRVSFYPSADKEVLQKEFNRFELTGEDMKLQIRGILDGTATEVYEIEFDSEPLTQIFYTTISELLRTGRSIKTLSDILEKAEIPIVKGAPNIRENTPNIWSQIQSDFDSSKQGCSPDLIKIHNQTASLKAEIHASVCELYNISSTELKLLFEDLKTPQYERDMIREKLED